MARRTTRISVILLAIVAFSTGSSARAAVLMYADQSPGTHAFYVLTKAVADAKSESLTLVTTASAFQQELAGLAAWSNIVVAARYSETAPAYAQALRDYAGQHEDIPIEFHFWHDNGTSPSSDTAVLGTTASVLWRFGETTIGYALATVAPDTTSVSGLQFADFENVTKSDPTTIAQIPNSEGMTVAQMIAAVIIILQENVCRAQCLNNWKEDRNDCTDTYNRQEGYCTTLYNTPPNVNPEQYTKCSNEAAQHRINCNSSALTTYNTCMAVCALNDPPE